MKPITRVPWPIAFIYLGPKVDEFVDEFDEYGFCMLPSEPGVPFGQRKRA